MKKGMLIHFVAIMALSFMMSTPVCAGTRAGPHWGYEGAEGPDSWHTLSPDFTLCGNGKSQSPVNIDNTVDANLEDIEINYHDTPLRIVNNGHTIQINIPPGSFMKANGKKYNLLQFHFHSPSENKYKGLPFDMEAHLVHKSDDGQLAVLGVFMKIGRQNGFIQHLWENIPSEVGHEAVISSVSVNARRLLPEDATYFHFSGSLTTPPCSERGSVVCIKNTH